MEDALTCLRPAHVLATRSGYSLHCSAPAQTWQIGSGADYLMGSAVVVYKLGISAEALNADELPTGPFALARVGAPNSAQGALSWMPAPAR